ncbi:uncharacterized protein LOC122498447 [Leptopilina heterotoma]|uniref:uncharacterized protein LOC122498447 n=1 Tax=Leptopilina heterotoma TaxID=63436 RepID=UPI001CA99FF9|nr:uncharacterized protein LOC122498447 [Leptopilina heterotoma]
MKLFFLISIFLPLFYQISSDLNSPNPKKCPKHMTFFLVNENSTQQYCDCDDTFLYHLEDNFCYDAYRQGPCPSGYYFVLSPGKYMATCQKNPCRIDGIVPFQGKCHFLWESGQPCKNKETQLGVNNDFQIECGRRSYNGYYYDWKTSKSCQKDSLLMPTNDEHTHYICKCKSSFIYSAKYNTCQQAYRQGTCSPGSYYVLPPGHKEPRCEVNPCHEDGLVPFKGKCHKVYKYGYPCSDDYTRLSVTEKTFKLDCLYQPPGSAGAGGIITAPSKACPRGSRRVVTECKRVFQ